MHAIEQALAWGVRWTGVTVHFAEEEVDGGPPILQEPVPVHFGDTPESLAARIHAVEHRLLPDAVRSVRRGARAAATLTHRERSRSSRRGNREDPPGADLRIRQDRAGRAGAWPDRVWASRSCRPAARPRPSRAIGVPVTRVEQVTGQPEILGGRVKTLHPKIHGGILAREHLAEDQADMAASGIEGIDLVCVNLYPFEAYVGRRGITDDELVEQIDIGGPAMVRAAAKNHHRVTILTSPDQYAERPGRARRVGRRGRGLRRDGAWPGAPSS